MSYVYKINFECRCPICREIITDFSTPEEDCVDCTVLGNFQGLCSCGVFVEFKRKELTKLDKFYSEFDIHISKRLSEEEKDKLRS